MFQNAELQEYVERTAEIRGLSSPDPLSLGSAEAYGRKLKENFITIGRLAAQNRAMLEEVLYPMLESPEDLTDEQVRDLVEFSAQILSLGGVQEFENLDLPLMSLVSARLYDEMRKREDTPTLIERLDSEAVACYSLMNMTTRITERPGIAAAHRARGREISDFFISQLERGRFEGLDESSREICLTNARFSSAFYEGVNGDQGQNEENLDLLERMLEIADDPFYTQTAKDLDWRYFRYRTLEYWLRLTDLHNERGFTAGQVRRIADKVAPFKALRASDPAYFDGLIFSSLGPLFCARNSYMVGDLAREEYEQTLLAMYRGRDTGRTDSDGCMFNIFIPLEVICLLGERGRVAGDDALLAQLYHNLNAYLFHMHGAGATAFMLEYFLAIIERFIEVPGGVTFERFVLQALAAFHPPTYIHSCMVAKISECLCAHLIDTTPEHLVGGLGCADAAEVVRRRDELVSYTYHAALCHDFGKVACIDTISVYGRNLLDFEFEIITAHPDMGARFLGKYERTRPYVDVARGHHRWYDDSRGYPADFCTAQSPVKGIIDVVACADCMDAATDAVGRSYSQSKTLDDYIDEVREGAGTRYAPWLVPLLERLEVHRELARLLSEERRRIYDLTYELLCGVIEGEGA